MEDQIGALGLVLNALVLFSTRYTDASGRPWNNIRPIPPPTDRQPLTRDDGGLAPVFVPMFLSPLLGPRAAGRRSAKSRHNPQG
jgi:hypothetical protein